MASVFGSSAASSISSTTGANESYGWWRRMSPCRIASKIDASGAARADGSAGVNGGVLQVAPVERQRAIRSAAPRIPSTS